MRVDDCLFELNGFGLIKVKTNDLAIIVVVTTPHTDANSIQKDNHQLNSKRQKGAPLSAPYSAYTKVGTFLLHKLGFSGLDFFTGRGWLFLFK